MTVTLSDGPWNSASQRLLADGAWGTELQKRGLRPGDSPERLNLESPELPRSIARDYLAAGSDIVLTNTFGGSRVQLERHGLADRTVELNRAGAALSREAADELGSTLHRRRPVVAGDIGPCGKLLLMGEVSESQLRDAFSEQAAALKEGGADWIVVETMSDLAEMSIAVSAASRATALPVVASMTYDRTASGEYRTMMGNGVEECVRAAVDAGASLVGANCGSGVDAYVPLATLLCTISPLPVWVKANAGLPVLVDGVVTYPLDADHYAEFVPRLLAAGVAVVGGCCGTSPLHVRAMRKILDSARW